MLYYDGNPIDRLNKLLRFDSIHINQICMINSVRFCRNKLFSRPHQMDFDLNVICEINVSIKQSNKTNFIGEIGGNEIEVE